MNKTILSTFLVALFLQTPIATANDKSELAREALSRAHKAFLEKRYKKVGLELKKVFKHSQGNELIEKNAIELLEETHRERAGKSIPVNWELPRAIDYFKIGFRLQNNKISGYEGKKIDIVGLMNDPESIEQVRLVKYPKQVILDKKRGVGSFDTWNFTNDKGFYLGRRIQELNTSGLYYIYLKLKGEDMVKGWFLAGNMFPSETPEVYGPADGEVLTTPNPEISWKNFFSPEYNGYEGRRFYAKVTKTDEDRTTVWNLNVKDPTLERAVIGQDGAPQTELLPGPYILHINYGERKKFGPIRLSRDARKIVFFKVK